MKCSSLGLSLLALLAAFQAGAAQFIVDPASSSVAVDVKASPPHSFTCDLQAYAADIQIDPETATVTAASFTFQLTDLETRNDKRNRKMHKWMDVDNFNTISWRMTGQETVGDQLVAHGELTMHGNTVPVDVIFGTVVGEGACEVTGVADFNYTDWDLPRIRLFLFTVNPELHVHFTLRGALVENN